MREERVRRLSNETSSVDRSPPPRERSQRRRSSRRRSASPGPADGEASEEGSAPRLSDPFPPLPEKKRRTDSRASAPDLHDEKTPTNDVTGPQNQTGRNSTDDVAVELEELIREMRRQWRRLHSADRITLLAAVGTIAGALMPWVSQPGRALQIGILSGGLLHVGLAVASIAMVVTRGDALSRPSLDDTGRRSRRRSLWHIIIGAVSTFLGMFFLVLYGLEKGPGHPVDVHFGLYWTLACGTGLSYGGFARFGQSGARGR